MSSQAQIEVVGLNKVIRNMRRLGATSDDFKQSMTRVGDKAVVTIRAATPRRTGSLANSIRASKRQTSVYLKAGNNRSRRSKATAFYAKFVNYGTTLQPAQYFMQSAMKYANYFIQQLERELTSKIRKAGF
jgi:HK97 gp10 family phage protein